MRFLILLCGIVIFCLSDLTEAAAQRSITADYHRMLINGPDTASDDSLRLVEGDESVIKTGKETHRPQIAALKSAVLPGWGQVGNGEIWKVPIIYAGFGFFAWRANDFHQDYIDFRDENRARQDTITTGNYPNVSNDGILELRDDARRDRDWFIILGAAWYLLNVGDAYVRAHFLDFDMSRDISLQVSPLGRDPMLGSPAFQPSFKLKITLR